MIKNIDLLSTEDKAFMIYNKKCFSNSTKSSINFNSEDWMTEVQNYFSTDELTNFENKPNEVFKNMLSDTSLINVKKLESVKTFINLLCNEVILETSENICEFISTAYNAIMGFKKNKKFSPDEIGIIYKMLYTTYIPYKITANVIYEKTRNSILSTDLGLNKYINSINKILFDEIGNTREPNASAFIIYSLMTRLGLTEKDKKVIDFFLMGKEYYNKENITTIKSLLNKLFNKKTNPFDVISMISSTTISNNMLDNLDFVDDRHMETNYLKSKLSEEINGDNLILGDDIFPDHEPVRVSDIIVELSQLTDEEIHNYIDKDKDITYLINDRELDYIKNNEEYSICKVLRKNEGFSTLAKVNNESYLLFKIYGDNKIYGISFPASEGGRRKLMEIEIPTKK